MRKNWFIACIALALSLHLVGCSSDDSNKADGDVAASGDQSFPNEGEGDFKKSENGDAPPGDQAQAPPPGDESLDGSKKDAPAGDAAPQDTAKSDDPDHEFPEDVAKSQTENVPPATDEKVFAQQDAAPAPAPEPAPAESAPAPVADSDKPKAPSGPYLKIKDAPFTVKGSLLNRVYLARKGDTVPSLSQKFYGADRAKDLKAWNPTLKSRAPKTGDKIYYSSPKDAQDQKMMVYYEEAGVAPLSYVTKDGDDIRKVATQLLGEKDSWKEIYATNASLDVRQGRVPAGLELRYWPATEVEAAPKMAKNGPPDDVVALPPKDDMAPPPAPTPMQVAAATPPPVVNTPPPVAATPVAPPPVAQTENKPPPPPQAKKKEPPPPPKDDLDADTLMMVGGVGALIIGLGAVFVIMQRQKRKKLALSQQTQI